MGEMYIPEQLFPREGANKINCRSTLISNTTGESGGPFLVCKLLGECVAIHFPPALLLFFFSLFKKKKKVKISSRTLIPLFMPGSVHSGSASFNDCGRMFPDKLRVSLFPYKRFLHYACRRRTTLQSERENAVVGRTPQWTCSYWRSKCLREL